MQPIEFVDYDCPWCGEPGSVAVAPGEWVGAWVEDCTVCCAPIVFRCTTDPWGDDPPQVAVEREGA